MAAILPLSPDEAYYWVWSRAPAASYLDHPPMVAHFIRIGVAIAGDTPLGIRLLSPLSAAIGSLVLADAAMRLFPGPGALRRGILAAALMNATLIFGVGAVTITPDTPLLLFWTICLGLAAQMVAAPRPALWLALGGTAGLAFDSKYTAALLVPSLLLWMLLVPSLRRRLRTPAPWGGAALGLLLLWPVIRWNAAHGWISFAKQGGRTGDFAPARAAQFLGELVAGQAGLATPVVALLCAGGAGLALRRARGRDPAWTLLACLTLVPAAVFAEHALGDRVQANWPAIVFPSACIAATGLGGRWRRLFTPALASGLLLTLAVWLQAAASPFPLPRRLDPTIMRLGGWPGFAEAVAAAASREHAAFVAADNYGDAAILARLLPAGIPVLGAEERWSSFDLPRAAGLVAGRPGLLVRSARRADPPAAADWAEIAPAGDVVRTRDGTLAETFHLYRVIRRPDPSDDTLVLLPRPR